MSDLFCAATLVVARHAEAEYDAPVASDAGGSLTTIGRAQARALGESLLARRVAAIWCSDMSRAVQTAEIAAAVLDVPVSVRAGLHEFAVGELAGQPFGPALLDPVYKAWMSGDLSVGCPGAETGADVFERNRDVLQSIVDQFRGETVLIVGHGGSIGLTLPRLAHNVANDFAWSRMLDNCATCEVVADADGWVLQTWGGEPVG